MGDFFIRAGSFIAIIVLGYVLKKVGFFKESDFYVLSKIVIKITLPATIVTSFAGKGIDPSMLTLVLLGFGGGALYMIAGYLSHLRHTPGERAFAVLNTQGYNIGTFTLPFIQSFLGPLGVIATSLFDTGNAVLSLGGAYSVATMVKNGSGFDLKLIMKTLVRSVPFMTYIIMLLCNLTGISMPSPVLSLAGIIANANSFLAMFMIGVGFKLEGDWSQIGRIVKILALRYGIATVLALIYYFLLPFSLEVRQTLVILAFSPIASAVPPYTAELKEDVGLSSAINSISIIISIIVIISLLYIMI